jgi:hypothetical protein
LSERGRDGQIDREGDGQTELVREGERRMERQGREQEVRAREAIARAGKERDGWRDILREMDGKEMDGRREMDGKERIFTPSIHPRSELFAPSINNSYLRAAAAAAAAGQTERVELRQLQAEGRRRLAALERALLGALSEVRGGLLEDEAAYRGRLAESSFYTP